MYKNWNPGSTEYFQFAILKILIDLVTVLEASGKEKLKSF